MFDILSHKGNANQTGIEISSHLLQNDFHQEHNKYSKVVGAGRKGILINCWWE
jgi:hypothetical protein